MNVRTLILILIVLMIVGVFPTWPYAHTWGYYPAGGLGTILLILIVLLVLGVI